jgi:hypothetical protein
MLKKRMGISPSSPQFYRQDADLQPRKLVGKRHDTRPFCAALYAMHVLLQRIVLTP